MPPKPTRGGRRPGAGRPRLPDGEQRTKVVAFNVTPETFTALGDMAGEGETAHTAARGIVERAVRRRKGRTT